MALFNILGSSKEDENAKERINAIQEEVIAFNDGFKLYSSLFELNEYKFLKFQLIGNLKVKTNEGCILTFKNTSHVEHKIDSDSTEIKTEFSSSLKIGTTEFDIDIDDVLLNWIQSNMISSLKIEIEKNILHFENFDSQLIIQLFAKLEEEKLKEPTELPEPNPESESETTAPE